MKKKKKPSTNEKADQFLAGLGTAGGAIGSPQLIGFGATDVQNQVVSGNTDETLTILKQAKNTDGKIAAFSSGGKIEEYCIKEKILFQIISMEHSPRASLTKFLFYILK